MVSKIFDPKRWEPVEGFKFTKKFKKPGKYNFYCTIHPDVMKMTVKVKG